MKVLLSIKPEFVEKIFSGEKTFEYRRSIFKNQSVDTIVIYSTQPVGKIVGEVKIEKIITEQINDLWEKTKLSSGISYEFFKEYFHDKDYGYAIKIKEVVEYSEPYSLSDYSSGLRAPQSFCYLKQ